MSTRLIPFTEVVTPHCMMYVMITVQRPITVPLLMNPINWMCNYAHAHINHRIKSDRASVFFRHSLLAMVMFPWIALFRESHSWRIYIFCPRRWTSQSSLRWWLLFFCVSDINYDDNEDEEEDEAAISLVRWSSKHPDKPFHPNSFLLFTTPTKNKSLSWRWMSVTRFFSNHSGNISF